MVLKNITPRDYQKSIFETASRRNTLVVLPTGVGKTLIALMLSIDRLKKYPKEKVIMLAPTRPLVEQHMEYFKKQLPELFAEIQIFTGTISAKDRQKMWQTSDIIFSTPQCIANDLKNYLYDLKEVSLLVIDEAHRCLKNYDYTTVVRFYKKQASHERILGLTASPGSDFDKVRQICKHLNTEEVESRTRDSADVKPYLQELKFEKIEVPFPSEFMEIRALLREIYDKKVEQLRGRNLLFGPATKTTLLTLQKKLFGSVSNNNSRNFNSMIGASLSAQAIKISHAMELLETQTLSGLMDYLLNLKEQAEQKKSKGVQTIVKSPEFSMAFSLTERAIKKKVEHPKIEELKVLVENELKKNSRAKIIIFSQFRETSSTISKKLNEIPGINSRLFIGQAKKQGTGISQKEQKKIIEQFKEGKINALCSTSIGEEGLDIPEVNLVVFYEPIPSAIRKIQRTGRTARLNPGKLMILMTKDTRDVAYHYASSAKERRMHKTIDKIRQEIKKNNNKKDKTLENWPGKSWGRQEFI